MMRGALQDDHVLSEKEKLELAIEHIHEKNIKNDQQAKADQDY